MNVAASFNGNHIEYIMSKYGAFFAIGGGVILVFGLIMLAAFWCIFRKAGQGGWKTLIPIYNVVVLCRIAGRPGWWVLLFMIPCVNFIFLIILYLELAKSFGKGGGYTFLMIFFPIIGFPMLGFSSARYIGPGGHPPGPYGGPPGPGGYGGPPPGQPGPYGPPPGYGRPPMPPQGPGRRPY